MNFRVISNKGRKLSAYGLFSAFPEQFNALLEDPSGSGKQFLVSQRGHSLALELGASAEHVDLFFSSWKESVAEQQGDNPAIRCLFYAAYEAANLIEALPEPKSALPGPVLWTFYPAFSLCFEGESIFVAAKDKVAIKTVLMMLDGFGEALPLEGSLQILATPEVTSGSDYKEAVSRVKAYIGAGDIFQANIARFWSMPFDTQSLTLLYDQLRQVNSAPFSSFVRIGSGNDLLTLVSASPERLFRVDAGGEVDTRPIAGTRRRAEGEKDASLRAELLLSEKERAEHIMLVDLERNDLGRVCRPGTVEVNEKMVIEQYATVQHIVSNVRGQLAKGSDIVDLFRAMFPGGTITGCPKVRCMEIIHELEGNARGPYTGGLGYMAWNGSSDMNILIRTFWHYRGRLHWAAGAGIVADSDPEHELIETEHKAEGLLRALAAR